MNINSTNYEDITWIAGPIDPDREVTVVHSRSDSFCGWTVSFRDNLSDIKTARFDEPGGAIKHNSAKGRNQDPIIANAIQQWLSGADIDDVSAIYAGWEH